MRALVLACFFLSGASGLIFEMVWTRGLTLVFGSTTLAISTVLTAFMGGLGLGSTWPAGSPTACATRCAPTPWPSWPSASTPCWSRSILAGYPP